MGVAMYVDDLSWNVCQVLVYDFFAVIRVGIVDSNDPEVDYVCPIRKSPR